MELYNDRAPFPVFDTELVKNVKELINNIMENDKIDYDDLPVIACKNCYNLAIEVDEDGNDICYKCESINEIKAYDNIDKWSEESDGMWDA